MKNVLKIGLVAVTVTLFGCSAMNTAIKKQELDVEARLSSSIVLEPLSPSDRIVYARIRDVSGNNLRSAMQRKIESQLESEGFVVTNDPKKANLMMNATILSAGKTTADEASRSLSSGYKGAAEGAALGFIAGGGSGKDSLQAGLLAGAAGFFADAMVEDVYYTFVMDVELRERPLIGDSITNSTTNTSTKMLSTQNTANRSKSKSSVQRGDNFNWIIHQTRIVTTANQMNLKLEDAIPVVQDKTATSLTEMLL